MRVCFNSIINFLLNFIFVQKSILYKNIIKCVSIYIESYWNLKKKINFTRNVYLRNLKVRTISLKLDIKNTVQKIIVIYNLLGDIELPKISIQVKIVNALGGT